MWIFACLRSRYKLFSISNVELSIFISFLEKRYQELSKRWSELHCVIDQLEKKIASQSGLVFSFVEGVLVNSLKNGNWILLDELNLASTETLECLSGILDSKSGSTVLSERG